MKPIHRRLPVILILIVIFSSALIAEVDDLSLRAANHILTFFAGKQNVRYSVVKLENYSILSDGASQKFYQLLVSKLEANTTYKFTDLFISFRRGKGKFNLNRIYKLNYMVYIKLMNNRGKLGVGIVVYSRDKDRIVSLKYLETEVSVGERELLMARDYGFKNTGFTRVVEMKVGNNLLDCKSYLDTRGGLRHFFYYPEKIEIYRSEGNNLRKTESIKLKWGRPYYPARQPEGKLFISARGNRIFLAAGGNFSATTKLFTQTNQQWRELKGIGFLPFRSISINNSLFVAGARYEVGKNFFKNVIYLAPYDETSLIDQSILEKQVPYFYSLDFSQGETNLESIHLIDLQYNYRFYTSDFEQKVVSQNKHGSALQSLAGYWLATSDYTHKQDRLFIYKLAEGSLRLVYENPIDGEIVFISNGIWKSHAGFWVLVNKGEGKIADNQLQFWSKTNE